jgi:hypothetical protein
MVAPITRHELGSGEVRPASAVHAGEPGLSGAVGVWHRVEAGGGRLAVAAPSRQVRSALDTAGLTKALSVYDLEADAVQACRHPAAG